MISILNKHFMEHPGRTAVEYGDLHVTYSELETRAAGIYRWIVDHKIEKGSFIGIYTKNRVDLIAAIIGILAAGCVFVPLDTSLPAKRIERLLGLTGTPVVITAVPRLSRPGRITDGCRTPLPTDPVYVYFTSGSTGTPRAVLGKNEGLLHFIEWETGTFEIDGSFRFSQLANPGFDAFLRDVFVPLCAGGCVCIPPRGDIVMDGDELGNWIERAGVDVVHCVPSVFRVFNTGTPGTGLFKRLKYILLAGEPVRPNELKRWYGIFGERVRLVNLYGATETTMTKTCYFIGKEDVEKDRIPVGRPIRGAQVFVFDKNMALCGREIAGEITIRTPYGTLGYLNDPGLTRRRFIPNPFTRDPDDVLYKTGDAGRILADGNIDVMGRLDRQIKIRGVRIEPGEIENAMLLHGDITEAAVVWRKSGESSGEERLCAYFVSRGEVDIPGLREDLAAVLPGYMIPAYFKRLERIPLTPNGKTDFRALPVPGPGPGDRYRAPANGIEEKLAKLWSEVLGIKKETIGTHDNFFHLGGHSLRAAVLVEGIRRAFKVECPLVKVFDIPFIKGQAEYIETAARTVYDCIPPAEKRDYYPQSSAQKRLFFLERFDHIGTGSNMPVFLRFRGKADKKRFDAVFKTLIRRHEALRTSFHLVDNEPVQRIHDHVDFEIECYPLPSLLPPGFLRPFDLSRAPLLRAGLAETAPGEYLLMVDIHHIIGDGTSVFILWDELTALYGGEEPAAPGLQYKDFSQWQNRLLATGYMNAREAYWSGCFPDAPDLPLLALPLDHPRPGVFTFEGERIKITLGPKDVAALQKLSEGNNTTFFMNLLAVFYVLLHKYTGQEDIIVGSGVAGRPHADLQRVIGLFVNMLPLRNRPTPGKRFNDFLAETRTNTIGAFENQDMPFEELVEKLELKRDVSRNPLFDAAIVNQNFERGHEAAAGGALVPVPGTRDSGKRPTLRNVSKFDLTLFAYEAGEEVYLAFEYYNRVFERETIRQLARHLVNLVKRVTETPGILISDIDILSGGEKRRLLYAFNDTAVPYPGRTTVHRLFEEQVERTPDAVAAVGTCLDSVTYRELNARANQLAGYLVANEGTGPDDRVGILLEQSVDRLVAVLGVLKAGGAYVPMEPGLPDERIKTVVCDADIRVVVSRKTETLRLRRLKLDCPSFRSFLRMGMEVFHDIYSLVEEVYKENPVPRAGPDHPAYVIYTSGTTGKPRGVIVEHRSLVNLCCWHNRYYGITAADRSGQFAAFGFDASVWEMFPYLIKGASIYLIPGELKLDLHELNGYFERVGITVTFLPTRLCEQFTALPNRYLKKLLTGGDKLRGAAQNNYTLYNNYGPTENTVVTTVYPVENNGHNIPIGTPIDNTRVFILNKDTMGLQPPGAAGELCISGDGLARGYINNPELTNSKFQITNYNLEKSFAGVQGAVFQKSPLVAEGRFYKTGDLARRLRDGTLQFLGRLDSQVKVRGYRIEPGEIEKHLTAHSAVKEAVVAVKGETGGDGHLCAYIVPRSPHPNGTLDPKELAYYLSLSLPGYMIPAYFVKVEKIPLTPGGKVDKNALPRPPVRRGGGGDGSAAPENDIQLKLRDIWSGLLEIEADQIGMDDNFFDLGGHSLKAAALLQRIREGFGVGVPLANVFQYPTIRGLARCIDNVKDETLTVKVDDDRTVLLKRGTGSGRHLFFIHGGSGELEGYGPLVARLGAEYSCWGIRAERMERYIPRDMTIGEAAGEYIKKIRRVRSRGPYSIIGRCLGGTVGFEMVRQLEGVGEAVAFFGVVDTDAPAFSEETPGMLSHVKDFVGYLPVPGLRESVETGDRLERVWEIVMKELEKRKNENSVVRELARIKEEVIPPYFSDMLPGFGGMDIRQLFFSLTRARMYACARDRYVPVGKIKAVMHHVASRWSMRRRSGIKEWEPYCLEPVRSFNLEGDSFSIFQSPGVDALAALFNRLLSK